MNPISSRFMRFAALWLVAGIGLGIFMGASHDHSMHPVHAHFNLLGFVLPAVFAGFYRLWPEAAQSRLAQAHFWLYAPASVVLMIALFILFRGVGAMEAVLAVSSIFVGISIVCFAIVVWKYTAAPQAAKGAAPGMATA